MPEVSDMAAKQSAKSKKVSVANYNTRTTQRVQEQQANNRKQSTTPKTMGTTVDKFIRSKKNKYKCI